MSPTPFDAVRFDGRQAGATAVMLYVESPYLVVHTVEGTVLDRERLHEAVVSEPFEHAPRLIALRSGATLEVPDPDGRFARELHHARVRLSPAVRLQRWWPGVVIALVATIAVLAGAYIRGLPVTARWVASVLPSRLEARMGEGILTVLDKHHLKPSRLDATRRARISHRFSRAAAAVSPGVTCRLEFRRTVRKNVNAMALPGGIIVLLDDLVHFAQEEDVVLGVLGHELGHVAGKHSTRQILQSVGVGALASLLWGDFAGVAASLPVAVGVLRYSRDFEREADEFAVAFLRAQGLSAEPLYRFFTRVSQRESRVAVEGIPDFLSTHPPTEERLERLRRATR